MANVPVTAGESKGWTLLFLVPLSSRPTLQKAADDAMKKGGGNLIVDAEVESFFMDLILASQVGLRVKGKVVNVPK
ncbi:MAG: hypothetical protein FJ272_05210 [Planctomycetes bacterium]|nr:hypothetical protein [Planctomycetota bacterium]